MGTTVRKHIVYLIGELQLVYFELILDGNAVEEVVVVHSQWWVARPRSSNERLWRGPRVTQDSAR